MREEIDGFLNQVIYGWINEHELIQEECLDGLLALLKQKIEKSLLTEDEMAIALCTYEEIPNFRHDVIAKAQLKKVLKVLEE